MWLFNLNHNIVMIEDVKVPIKNKHKCELTLKHKDLNEQKCDWPLVLLPDEVLLRQVDQVDHRLGGNEQMLVQNFDLKMGSKSYKISISFSYKKFIEDKDSSSCNGGGKLYLKIQKL